MTGCWYVAVSMLRAGTILFGMCTGPSSVSNMSRMPPSQPPPEHDLGLAYDLRTLSRRRALTLFAGVGLAALVGCAEESPTTGSTTPGSADSTTTTSPASTKTDTAATCDEIPEETAGPYPGDGSNGPNVLTESGIVRSDIRSSFGSSTGTADGVPLTVTLSLLDQANGCAALSGAAVYLWHCDREGRYSLYSGGATDQNYLRGVQEADGSGQVTFTTIFPAAYSGRWPHIHFEVYSSLAEATSAGNVLVTSQLAFPEDVCDLVYATEGYEQSVQNMAQTSLESDMVFRDGVDQQLAMMTGAVGSGFTAALVLVV
jgi:protocatechuate 3,4-dioxygenase beta subunit